MSASVPVPGDVSCSHFGASGPEHRDSDWGEGGVPENRLWRELGDGHLAKGPGRRSCFQAP